MSTPDAFPEWATNDVNTLEPNEGSKTAGFLPGSRPPAQWVNWLLQKSGQWAQATFVANANSWSASKSLFDVGNTLGGSLYVHPDGSVDLISSRAKARVRGLHQTALGINTDTEDDWLVSGEYYSAASRSTTHWAFAVCDVSTPTFYRGPLATRPSDATPGGRLEPTVADTWVSVAESAMFWSNTHSRWYLFCAGELDSGNARVIYTNPDSNPANGTWTTAQVLTGGDGFSPYVGVAESPDGVILAVSTNRSYQTSNESGASFDDLLASVTTTELNGGVVWDDARGRFTIVKRLVVSGNGFIWLEHVGGDGVFLAVEQITNVEDMAGTVTDLHSPCGIAVDPFGGLMLTYYHRDQTTAQGSARDKALNSFYLPPGASLTSQAIERTVIDLSYGAAAAAPPDVIGRGGTLVWDGASGRYVGVFADAAGFDTMARLFATAENLAF